MLHLTTAFLLIRRWDLLSFLYYIIIIIWRYLRIMVTSNIFQQYYYFRGKRKRRYLNVEVILSWEIFLTFFIFMFILRHWENGNIEVWSKTKGKIFERIYWVTSLTQITIIYGLKSVRTGSECVLKFSARCIDIFQLFIIILTKIFHVLNEIRM